MKRFLLAACGVLFFSACTRDAADAPDRVAGKEVMVELHLSVSGLAADGEATHGAAVNPLTRVIPAGMNPGGEFDDGSPVIRNMWIIQFDGDTPDARMVGAPRFLSVEDGDLQTGDYPLTISVPLVGSPASCHTLFVANIRQGGTYNWNLTAESTFANVITRVKTIQTENGAFEDFSSIGGGPTLLMSAVTTGPVEPGTVLEPEFLRNVAKITLNLKLAHEDMSIASVRLRNVSNRIVFADAALEPNGILADTVFPVDASLIDYEPITDASLMPGYGQTATFSWYVPRNQQGVNLLSTSVKQKTFYAPVNATFIEIVALKTVGAKVTTSIFRVYPGPDMISDFNLTPNHEYTVGLNVVGSGTDPADSRVQTFDNTVDYSGYDSPASRSNSFIINPAPNGGGDRTYLIGVHQVNRYWGRDLPGYGNKPANTIVAGDPWYVSLIWSDLEGLYNTGTPEQGITLLDYNGTGVGAGTGPDQVFALRVPPELPAGNFVLGIKKAGNEDFLWSWHFWVTDYSPDSFNRSLIDHQTYTYVVPGGQVERMASGPSNETLWSPDGLYADRVMMDRYLGAVENFFNSTPVFTARGWLYYQFGRKDPMPSRIPLVTDVFIPSNVNISIVLVKESVPIATSVNNPWVFYTGGDTSNNWANEADGKEYQWNDPATPFFTSVKSIYDPCPPGWRMPAMGTWDDFMRKIGDNSVTIVNPGRDLGWTFGRGIGTADMTVNGVRYWPGTTLDAPVGGRIWYPAAAGLNSTTAAGNGIGGSSSLWQSTPSSATSATAYTPGSGGGSTRGTSRTVAYPARCIMDSW